MIKSPGQIAYEADVAIRPTYPDQSPRAPWAILDDIAHYSWGRDPSPRIWRQPHRREA